MSDYPSNPRASESIAELPVAASALRISNTRQSVALIEDLPSTPSEGLVPSSRRFTTSMASSVFTSTLTPPGSRPHSPIDRGSPARSSSTSLFEKGTHGGGSLQSSSGRSEEPIDLIMRSYAPHIVIYSSGDVDDLAREKGFPDGLWKLLRPFGEHIHGKVTVRDSNGYCRTLDDFGVRFVRFGNDMGRQEDTQPNPKHPRSQAIETGLVCVPQGQQTLSQLEILVKRRLNLTDELGAQHTADALATSPAPAHQLNDDSISPYYALYLKRLLGEQSLVPHETFAHPVACVITISSRSKNPIDDLRRLYDDTTRSGTSCRPSLPVWVDTDYLRYYVLVHDEERDEISRSMSLFDQMKRHFGLHCHLLRLRSTRSARTDDDSIPLPHARWISAAEELEYLDASERRHDSDEDYGVEDATAFVFESDVTAIRSFVREMVTQSLIPTMERHISIWNDQVASRRRGIAGRFMSLSRKWAGLGASSRSSTIAGLGVGGAGSSSAYDPLGFYRAESHEAIMRKLADFAFMLRDWKLAHSTYDLLRSDFSDAKTWKYHAAASEMAAISLLMTSRSLSASASSSTKTRLDVVDQMLEASFYSYKTRCDHPVGALRVLLAGIELLRLHGGICIDSALRWGMLLLGSRILGPIGDALIKERLSIFSATKQGIGGGDITHRPGSRKRKSGIWSVLAAESWVKQGRYDEAQRCLNRVRWAYVLPAGGEGIEAFDSASRFISHLEHIIEVRDGCDHEGVQHCNAVDEGQAGPA